MSRVYSKVILVSTERSRFSKNMRPINVRFCYRQSVMYQQHKQACIIMDVNYMELASNFD